MSDQTFDLLSEEFIFMLASNVDLPSNPCLLCRKADGSSICPDAVDCQRFIHYQQYKRDKKQRWENGRSAHDGGACEECPVKDACPVSFSATVSWCRVKMDALGVIDTTHHKRRSSRKMHHR